MSSRGRKSARIIIIFMIVLLIILLIVLNCYNNRSDDNETVTSLQELSEAGYVADESTVLYTDTSITEIKSTSILLAIQDCINKYYGYNYDGNSKAILQLLNDDYIEENSVTSNNVFNKLSKVNQTTNIFVINAYEQEISFDQEYKYYVYGEEYNSNYNALGGSMFVVNLDLINMTFKIIPYGSVSEQEFESTVNELISNDSGSKIQASDAETSSIEANEYNTFELESSSSNQLTYNIILNYLNYYYYLKINNIEKAYNLLDEEYVKLRFSSQSEYNTYIKNNFDNEFDIQYVNLYYTSNGDKVYIGVDNYERYYIFTEESPMNFTIMLDSYTNPLSETVQKYEDSSEAEKACMCVEFVKEMINNNDYQSIYNHLNATFATNNFSTVTDLQKYIETNYFDWNTFEYELCSESSGSYIVKIKVLNLDDNSDYFETSFVVKLGDEIDEFEMSFSVT